MLAGTRGEVRTVPYVDYRTGTLVRGRTYLVYVDILRFDDTSLDVDGTASAQHVIGRSSTMVTAKNSSSTTTTKRDHEAVVAGNAHHDARWLIEDRLRTNQCVLTAKGVENIANHKYVPGHYTHLDNMCNPMWTYLTELLLPLWIAPNMVTTLGGLHCAISYLVVRTLCKDYNESVPNWVILLCAYCTFAYYTLDCMDGKQARRTQQSSPLGQLFDHGAWYFHI